jgi:hypothetical protein
MASFFNLTLDLTAPSGLAIQINSGALYTTSTTVGLQTAVDDANITGYQMKIWGIADAENEAAAEWVSFNGLKNIVLTTGDGLKTVYVKVRDDVGNETSAATALITLDTAVPIVTITGPDRARISKVSGFDTSNIGFMADVDFVEYRVCVVPNNSSLHDVGVVIPTTGGSENTSGTGAFEADTAITVIIKGADLDTASSGDGVKIVKVFVKTTAGVWSVA